MTLSLPITDPAARTDAAPLVALAHLDDLWFQVAGTLCNLACTHCFISCSPHNHAFGFLDLETVKHVLQESVKLGVKEYYFTGGEPFLNRDLTAMLEATLQFGPATVLTNATVFRDEWLAQLRRAEEASPYSLEFRVSIDGFRAADNDAIRGAGAFDRAIHGVRQLVAHGFLPIITTTRASDTEDDQLLVEGFMRIAAHVARARLHAAAAQDPADPSHRRRGDPGTRLSTRGARHGGHDGELRSGPITLPSQSHRHRPRHLRLPDPDRRPRRTARGNSVGGHGGVPIAASGVLHLLPVRSALRQPFQRTPRCIGG